MPTTETKRKNSSVCLMLFSISKWGWNVNQVQQLKALHDYCVLLTAIETVSTLKEDEKDDIY
jgi:hypothetical protein